MTHKLLDPVQYIPTIFVYVGLYIEYILGYLHRLVTIPEYNSILYIYYLSGRLISPSVIITPPLIRSPSVVILEHKTEFVNVFVLSHIHIHVFTVSVFDKANIYTLYDIQYQHM